MIFPWESGFRISVFDHRAIVLYKQHIVHWGIAQKDGALLKRASPNLYNALWNWNRNIDSNIMLAKKIWKHGTIPSSWTAAMFGRYWIVVHSHSMPRFHDPKLPWPTISQKLLVENQTIATLKVLDTSNEAMIESRHFRNPLTVETSRIISCVRSALTSMCKPEPVQGSTRITARNKQTMFPPARKWTFHYCIRYKQKIKHTNSNDWACSQCYVSKISNWPQG